MSFPSLVLLNYLALRRRSRLHCTSWPSFLLDFRSEGGALPLKETITLCSRSGPLLLTSSQAAGAPRKQRMPDWNEPHRPAAKYTLCVASAADGLESTRALEKVE